MFEANEDVARVGPEGKVWMKSSEFIIWCGELSRLGPLSAIWSARCFMRLYLVVPVVLTVGCRKTRVFLGAHNVWMASNHVVAGVQQHL
jgi:hypothetical protein